LTDFSSLKSAIADYANRTDWSDALVTSFIRSAESKFNAELRVDRMIQNDQGLIISRCAPLPDDWLEMEFVQIQADDTSTGFWPIQYRARDEFFKIQDTDTNCRYYTIEGRQIYFSGPPDDLNGIQFKIVYFGEVPVLTDLQQSWVYTKYPDLYLYAALIPATLHAVGEEEKAGGLKQLVEDMITKLNADYQRSKASGSRVHRSRRRSFG
jgi:hypothetical protein